MNRNWIVAGIAVVLILVALIIGVPTIITTLLLKFIFDLEPLAMILVLLCTGPLLTTIFLIAIIWLAIYAARLLGFAVAQTWPRDITLSAISIASAFLSGLTLAKVGNIVITHYALNPVVGSVIYFIAVILYMMAASLAIGQVTEAKNKKWAYSVIVIVFSCLAVVGAINIYRNDNYDPKTGKSIVYITPSTGKIWRNKPAEINFDPSNGEKLVLATPEMLAKVANKSSSASTPANLPASGRIFSFPVPAKGIYTIDGIEIKKGQEFTFLTYDAPIEFRVRNEKGDCWERVENNLPWRALINGKLQIRAGNMPANVTLNIKT